MERSVNPNSPEEVRRAIQRSYGNADTVAAGLASHIVIVDAHHAKYTDAEAIAAIQGDASWNATDWDTAYGWEDHGAAGYLKADGSVNLTGNLTVDAAVTIDGRDISADGAALDGLVTIGGGKVQVDAAATSDYLGAAFNDGALRTGTGISYADGGNFVTLTTNDGEIDHGSLAGIGDDDHTDYHTDARAATWLAAAHETTYTHADIAVAIGWEDHATFGYLTSETSHADVLVDGDFASQGIMLRGAGAGSYSILADASANWNTAHGWGDHGVAGYISATLTQEEVEDHAGALVANATGTHTGIAITYQDDTGDMDFVVDHDAASNYDANDHIDHTTVTFSAGVGLAGGGTLADNRSFALDINGLGADTIVGGDAIAFYDDTGGHVNKTSFTNFNTALDHGSLGGLAGDDHTIYLLADGSRELTGDLAVSAGITIDGRDLRLDGQDLDLLVLLVGKVKVDASATSDYIGAAFNDGALRTSTGISFADGGNFITLTTNDGEIDHGSLAGIGDDDHTGYHTDGRADTWLNDNHETTYDHSLIGAMPAFDDDEALEFGTGADYWFIYDSEDTQLQLWTSDAGGGKDAVVWSVTDGSTDIAFLGSGSFGTTGAAVEGLILETDARVYSEFLGPLIQAEVNTGADETLDNTYEAMKFTADGNHVVRSIAVSLKRTGVITNGGDYLVFMLYTDDAGEPGTKLGTMTNLIMFGSLTTGYLTNYSGVSDGITLSSGTDYWIVFRLNAAPVGGTIQFERNSLGTAMHAYGSDGVSWSTTNNKSGWCELYGEDNIAVYGASMNSIGILGESVNNVAIRGRSINNQGVSGSSVNSYGLLGASIHLHGLVGSSTNGSGIYATSINSYGVYGISTNDYGIRGKSTNSYGVQGNGTIGVAGGGIVYGVFGTSGGTGTGVYGTSAHSRAGHFLRNAASPSTGNEVVLVEQGHADDTSVCMVIQQDGSGDILRLYDGAVLVAAFKDGGDVDIIGNLDVTGTVDVDGLVSVAGGGVRGVHGEATNEAGVHGESDTHHGVQGIGNNSRAGYFHRDVEFPSANEGAGIEVFAVRQDHAGNDNLCALFRQDGPGDILHLFGSGGKVAHWTTDGDCVMTGELQAGGYKSSDGSAGVDVTFTVPQVGAGIHTITIKNGIITSVVTS